METVFKNIVKQLTDDQTPRVWSLLVTVFGELAQEDGSGISGALLSKLTTLMGIKPEAMRVALHRLRKDGWIKSARNGRSSIYSLTDWGRAQSAEVTPKIYNTQPVTHPAWLVVFDPSQPVKDHVGPGAWIGSHHLITTTPDINGQVFAAPIALDTPLPDWMTGKICDPKIIKFGERFHRRLSSLRYTSENIDGLDCFEISAIRILIVDSWRRIVLKMPDLPDHVFPAGWLGLQCRERVATLLCMFEKQDVTDMEAGL